MESTAHDWLVDVNVAVPDFKVEAAVRVGTDPGFIFDIGSLAAEIRQGY